MLFKKCCKTRFYKGFKSFDNKKVSTFIEVRIKTLLKKFTYRLLVIALLVSVNTLFGQNKKNQEFKQQKSSFSKLSPPNRTKEVTQKLVEAKKIFEKNPEEALDLVHDALLISIKEDYVSLEAETYEILGEFNYKLNEYNLSYKNYNKAIAIYEKLKLVSNYNYMAVNNLKKLYYPTAKSAELIGNYESSLTYYNLFLETCSSDNDKVKAFLAIGDVYLKQKELKGAEINYGKALKIEKKRNNQKGLVVINLKLGELEKAKNNSEQAIQYYRSSQSNALQIDDDKAVNEAYGNISGIYQSQNNIDDGIEINQEALSFNKKRNNQTEIVENNINLANFYLQQNKNDEAIQSLQNSIEITNQTGDLKNRSKAVQVLSEAYSKTGLTEEAEKKYKEYLILEDSLYKMRERQLKSQNLKGEMLENAQNKLSLLEKDKQLSEKTIELLRQEKLIQDQFITKQRVITYSLILGIVILIITAFLVYRSNKAKNKANQMLVLKSLRAQMNPHFIFNALNSVNSFISKSDERAANRYLSDFSRLMRDVMENSQEDFISLAKEIDILSMYLKLEHHRFNDKFEYNFEVDEGINAEDFFIPPMLIQPYIENAVWHGLRYKKEKGFLKVSINQSGKTIIVKVEDNGIGRQKSQEIKTDNQKIQKSTGLKNIDSRLKIISDIYKAKLDVQIEDNQPTGTIVTVKIHQENFIKKEI